VNKACSVVNSAEEICENGQTPCRPDSSSEVVIGQLESLAASDCLLPLWRRLDRHATRARADAEPLPAHVREGSVRHMMHLAKLLEVVCIKDIQLCITLFDAYCARHPGGAPLEDLPVTVAAIIVLVAKVDGAGRALPWWARGRLSEEAKPLTLWLGSVADASASSKVPKVVTEEGIGVQEGKLLRVLGWSVHLPTIESWIILSVDRLNILSTGKYQKSLEWLRNSFLPHMVHSVMLRRAPSPELTSGYIAGGLLCLGLFAAQLLPPAALKPDGYSVDDWEKLVKESQPHGKSMSCALSSEEYHDLLEQLQDAMGRDSPHLATDCGKVLTLIQEAMAEAKHRASLQASRAASELRCSM